MADLKDLYQQVILDHNRSPRNFRELPDANRTAEGYNPLCGDRIHLWVKVEDGKVADIGFRGTGCAISQAAASLMTSTVKGKTVAEAEALFAAFHRMITSDATKPAETGDLGKLAAFAGVREFPARVKCANLSWHTLHAALQSEGGDRVSTEA